MKLHVVLHDGNECVSCKVCLTFSSTKNDIRWINVYYIHRCHTRTPVHKRRCRESSLVGHRPINYRISSHSTFDLHINLLNNIRLNCSGYLQCVCAGFGVAQSFVYFRPAKKSSTNQHCNQFPKRSWFIIYFFTLFLAMSIKIFVSITLQHFPTNNRNAIAEIFHKPLDNALIVDYWRDECELRAAQLYQANNAMSNLLAIN